MTFIGINAFIFFFYVANRIS